MLVLPQSSIRTCGFNQRDHPPHSPDLALRDYYLFWNLEFHDSGRRYEDDQEVTEAAEAWFDHQSEDLYKTGILSLKDKWSKCIKDIGDCTEKWN